MNPEMVPEMATAPKKKCLIADCGKLADCRGLCLTCYSSARAAVKAKKCTWEELEKWGLALAPKPFVGKFPGKFLLALDEFRMAKATKAREEREAAEEKAKKEAESFPDLSIQ